MRFFFKIQYRSNVKGKIFLRFQHFLYPLLGCVPDWHQVDGYAEFRIALILPHPHLPAPSPAMAGLISNFQLMQIPCCFKIINSSCTCECRTLPWPERKLHLLISSVNSMDVLKKGLLRKLCSVKNFEPAKELFQ